MRKIATLPWLSTLTIVGLWMGQIQLATAKTDSTASNPTKYACSGAEAASNNWTCITPAQLRDSQRSLTVIGQGQVTSPADTAVLEFRLGNRDASAGSTPLSAREVRQLTETALQPALNALSGAGVPAKNITIQASSLQNQKLLVTLDNKPSQERVQQVVETVEKSLASNRQLFIQSIGATYAVNYCDPLERTARRIALRDAHNQVTTLAQDVNAQLGPLFSVTVMPLVGTPASSGCGTKVGVPVSPLVPSIEESTPPYDPSDKPEVTVRSQVSVTYDLQTITTPPQ